MTVDTVKPPEDVVETVAAIEEPVVQDSVDETNGESQEPTQVPLHALQKERQKRQEAEDELRWYRDQANRKTPAPEPEDNRYESATKEDLNKSEQTILRKVEESSWIKQNPERYEKVNQLLPEFLKRRPNLAAAIEAATNRYEEAWELMDKLTPKEQQKLKPVPPAKKEAPGNPSSVSKGASMNQAVDVMAMSDSEFSKWRADQKRRR